MQASKFSASSPTSSRSRSGTGVHDTPALRVTRFMIKIGLPLLIIGLIVSADLLTAAQQGRLFKVTINRHAMAALRQDVDKPIDQSLRAHWITPDADGNIQGRISAIDAETADASPIKQLTVTLLKKGQQICKAKTDKQGRFLLPEVDAGVYTLVAWGKNGFLAYGVHVLPRLEELELGGADDTDFNARKTGRTPLSPKQRQAYYVSYFNLPQDAVVADEFQIDAAAVPPEFTALRKISQNYMSASSALSVRADQDDLKAIAKADLTSGGFQFPLSPDGHFHGRLQPIATEDGNPAQLSDMNLFLLQEDVELLRVAAEENGDFRMNDVEPGVYSLVAAGEDGFAALSLELVAAEAADGNDAEQNNAGRNFGSNNIHRVSTVAAAPAVRQQAGQKADIPSLGIAIVTDKNDLKQIFQMIEQISPQNLVNNGPPNGGFNGGNPGGFAPGGFAPSGFAPGGFASGGFAPGGFASAPIGATSFVPASGFAGGPAGAVSLSSGSRFAGLSRLFGAGGGGRLLGLAGLAVGVTAIADDSSSPPVAISASTIGS